MTTALPASVTIVDLPTGTTITGAELLEAVQTVGGVPISIQIPISQIATTSMGALPTGGATGQLLSKASGTSFSSGWSSIVSFVAVGTALATTGTATSIVAFVPNQGITSTQLGANAVLSSNITAGGVGSTQIANNAVGTNQIASSLGIASSLSVGTLLTVGGTATVTGTTILNGGLQVTGTTLMTGILGLSGTSLMTGTHGVVGTSIFTGTFVLGNNASGVLVSSSTGVLTASATAGAMALLNTLSPSGVASTNDTSSFTSTYKNYLITFENIVPATNTTTFQMQIATSGSNFVSGAYVSIAQINVSSIIITDTSTTAMLLTGIRATTAMQTSTLYGLNGSIRLFDPANTVIRKSIVGEVSYAGAGASVGTTTLAQGVVNALFDGNSNAVTGVNFAFSSGNIATGVIKIYGMV